MSLLLAVAISCLLLPVASFSVQPEQRTLAPTAITFAQYAADRRAGLHPGLGQRAPGAADPIQPSANAVQLTFMHINDLYELLGSGSVGGVARVGTLLRNLETMTGMDANRTVSVLAGDLFSPSALSTVPVDGQLFQGKQMVAVMNAMGLDIATLGNHETDVKEPQFRARMSESAFPWLCANARNTSYPNLRSEGMVLNFPASATSSQSVTVGVYGLTLDSNNQAFENYDNFTNSMPIAQDAINALRAQNVDVVVALTHLPWYHDQTMTRTVTGIDIVMGGQRKGAIGRMGEQGTC
jgi:5'-nucleotidase/UDP-sugar diphosphatase